MQHSLPFKESMHVLGIMSGTSLDGVDYALCSVSKQTIRLQSHWHVPFPKKLRLRLDAAAQGHASSHETAQLHHDLGRFYAANAAAGPNRVQADLVGLHGQTIFHQSTTPAATLQLGEPAYLAESLRVPVVNNFRAADIAAGGEGAPLATLFHQVVFGRRGQHVCVQNLGGIGNVTSIDWSVSQSTPRVIAFDTGPANMLIDLAVRRFTNGKRSFDSHGRLARKGKADDLLANEWLRHSFFKRPPPKSTGREAFGESFLIPAFLQMEKRKLSHADQLATLTEFSARSIALNYRLHLNKPQRVILSGGGALNDYLVERIELSLQNWHSAIAVTTSATLGWHPQTIEPAAFALLAFRAVRLQAGNVPSTTGANHPAVLGQLTHSQPAIRSQRGRV